MIVRIQAYGQYELPDEHLPELQVADREIEAAIEAGDERAFEVALSDMIVLVQTHGRLLEPGALVASEAFVPVPGTTLEEARRLVSDDGLIPDQ